MSLELQTPSKYRSTKPHRALPDRLLSGALSLLIHAAGILAVIHLPGQIKDSSRSANDVVDSFKLEHKVLYVSLPKLKMVSAATQQTETSSIVAPRAKRTLRAQMHILPALADQLIWQAGAKTVLPKELLVPDELSVRPQPPPPPRKFEPPVKSPRAATPQAQVALEMEDLKLTVAPKLPVPVGIGIMAPVAKPQAPAPPSKVSVSKASTSEAASNSPTAGSGLEGKPGTVDRVVASIAPAPTGAPAPAGIRIPRPTSAAEGAGGGGILVPGIDAGGAATTGSQSRAHKPQTQITQAERMRGEETATVSAPLYPTSRALKPLVERHFANRVVYMCLLNNLDPSEGVLWFSELKPAGGGAPIMRAPNLVRAEGAALGAAVEARGTRPVALRFQIAGDGSLEHAEAQDEPNAEMAVRLIEQVNAWVFVPARRNGEATPVDALLELTIRAR